MYIQVSHLAKSFAGQSVLGDITFVINSGDKVALLGKNGSGKSTLFKILTGEEEADSGIINKTPALLSIGYLPQIIADNSALSSGQKLQAKLAEIISDHPDMLLLDEPTNHLDWQSMEALKKIMQTFPGPVLFVSHDRYFIDQIATKTLVLEQGIVRSYGGNYSFYRQQKLIESAGLLRQYQAQQKHLHKLTSRIETIKNRTQQLEVATTGTDHYARRKAAKAARSAISMEKRIDREIADNNLVAPPSPEELKVLFRLANTGSETVVFAKSITFLPVISNYTFTIARGQRVSLLGTNGSGKTTLIKLILGQLQPQAGRITLGNGIQIGYLSQEHQELDTPDTVLEYLVSGGAGRTDSYKLLRRFLLPPEKISQPVNLLSSGEKAKLLLAKIMLSGANFIVLDEPTNHLDIPSREALEDALRSFPGTLLVATHDRYFMENIGITDSYRLPLAS